MTQATWSFPDTVESVVTTRRNGPLIATAAVLWIGDDDLVVDVTWGRGRFWTHYRPRRLIAHDLTLDGVDFRNLPEPDASVDVVVFDPPYIAQGGRTTSSVDDMLDRFGLTHGPRTIDELHELFADGITEAARVLKPGGRLLVKCMDFINGGRYRPIRHHVVNVALDHGFEQVDEFIHHSGRGPQPVGVVQQHSRRAHSILAVFRRLDHPDTRP